MIAAIARHNSTQGAFAAAQANDAHCMRTRHWTAAEAQTLGALNMDASQQAQLCKRLKAGHGIIFIPHTYCGVCVSCNPPRECYLQSVFQIVQDIYLYRPPLEFRRHLWGGGPCADVVLVRCIFFGIFLEWLVGLAVARS
jgi:hypothetical protein